MVSLARRVALAVLAFGLAAALLLAAVHLPWVERRVVLWAASTLEARGIAIRSRALTYNLAARSVHAEGLTVSTTADPQHPFFEADRLDVTLARSVFAGRLAITSLVGDGVRMTLARRQDGSTNYPRDDSPASTQPAPFPIGALTLTNASVVWQDDVLGMGAVLDAVSANLDRGRGGVTLGRPATLRAGAHETSMAVSAQVAWDGATLSLDTLRVVAPEGTLNTAGSIGVLIAGHPLALDATGSADLDRMARWFLLDPRPIGIVTLRVHAAGSTADPNADVTLASQNVTWQGLTGVTIDGAVHVDSRALDARSLTVRGLGGSATGHGRLSFSPGGERANVQFDWKDIDGAALLTALGAQTTATAGTRLDGRLAASWTAWSADALTGTLEATTRATPPAPARFGLAGTLTLDARAGAWRGAVDQWLDDAIHVEGRADGRVSAASLAASTVNATVGASAASLPDLWRTLSRFDVVTGVPPASLNGGVRAEVMLSGRVDDPRLAGRIEGSLEQLNLSAAVSGTVSAPAIDGRVVGDAFAMAGQHADHLDAAFSLTRQTARVEPLVLTQANGRLTINGQYDLRTSAITAALTADSVSISPVPGTSPGEILVPVTGVLSGEFRLDGTVADPRGAGHVVLEDTRVLDRDAGHVSTDITVADHQLRATIAAADLFTTGTASLVVNGPAGAFVIDMQTRDADLAALAARLLSDQPVTGQTTFATHIEGTRDDVGHARTTVNLQRLDAAVGDVAVRSTSAARASYDGRTLDVTGLTIGIGPGARSQFHLDGRLGTALPGTLVASLDGQAADFQQLARVFSPAGSPLARMQLDGRVRVDARAPGSLDRPALTADASVDQGHVTFPGESHTSTVLARASYGGGLLKLLQLDATWQGASASATADIPIALVAPGVPIWLTGEDQGNSRTGRLDARFDSITPDVLSPFVPAETLAQLAGLVTGTLTLAADRPVLAAVRGQLVLDRADLSVAGVAFDQQEPTRIDVADGRARVTAWTWGGSGNALTVGGSVTFDGTPALDLSLDGTIDVRALGAFIPQVTSGGTATLTARVTGAPAAPQLNGRINLQGGELRVASPRLVVSDFGGSLLLSQDDVTVVDASGQANGGTVTVAGALKHSGFTLTTGRLTLTGRGLALAIPDALKTQVDLDLTLSADRGALTLGGDATVLAGAYREPISLATGFLQALQSSPTTIQLDRPSTLDAMALDIHLTTSEDIIVDNNYAKLGLAADVRIGGTLATPILAGRAEAREGGRIFLGGNVYQVVGSGAIDFSNPTRTEPDLAITAVARVAGYDITLNLSGPPATLQTTLTSEPPLSQGEIVSLLVTGQTQNASALAISGDQVIGYLSGEVLGVTGRALGLDALRVERGQDVRFDAGLVASETDPSSRLTFGKQVTRNVEVVFSQNLKDSGKLTWIIGYRPKPSIELRVVSQDNQLRIYDFRHELIIGGAARAKATVSRPAALVASVRFTGTPDLQTRLKVKAGTAFDFFRWQQDRDRLEASLRADGYFEARVAAHRSDASSASVDLTYDIRRGPRTVVDIVGVPDNRTLHREIEHIWSDAVFDGFLLDQAKNAAREAMVRGGYMSAIVTTSIRQPDAAQEKHLVVAIQPGPRYTHRGLVFTGQQHVTTARLEEMAGATASPWVDPAPLIQAITTMYRNEGFLDAGVSVSTPRFDGNTATLPIVIREGPQFRLASVTFVGPSARTPAAAEKAFGLKPGAALTRVAADAAVQALANAYRTQGFTVVRVTLTNEAERATGLVALTVTVDEGPQLMLREVEIEGTRRTSPALVSAALKLVVGQPVDLAAWAQARKRLFDTGVFRQVDIQAVPIESAAGDGASTESVQPIRARVTLEEFPPLRLRYGFEVEDQVQPLSETRTLRPGVAGDLTYRNVFGRAATTGLALRYTKDFEAARGFFSTPSFWGLPLTSSVFLARSREQRGTSSAQPFVVDKSELTAEQRFRAGRRLQLAYSYNFQRNHTFDRNPGPDNPLAFDLTINIARLTATSLVDTRDDLVDATRGLLSSSSFEYGAAALGSDLRFAKYFMQQNYYRTLGHGLVFATSGRLGLGAGYGQDLIQSERFLAGGGNSVRGYKEDSLGPLDIFGDAAGGNALLVFNEEIRFPIAWRFRGVGFFDAGNVFATPGDLRFSTLRAGAGIGLRVQTPFALLRVDAGTPLGARPGEARTRWFFSIGQSF